MADATMLPTAGTEHDTELSANRRRFGRFGAAAAALCIGLTAQSARADDAANARFHDELARGHYKAGRFEQALREFFLEQRISPNPRIAFNIALCFQDLKRKEEAFQYFSEYLASDDVDAERREYARKTVDELKSALSLVRVASTPAGGLIYVDRRELGSYGSTPKTVALTPGEHRVWVEVEGHRPATATVVARRGEERFLAVTPERIVGALNVTSAVSAQVHVRAPSGETLAQGPSPLAAMVPPGSYEVTVLAPAHLPWMGLARVEADKPESVSAVPLPAPEPTGSITVTSNVPGALVELNGNPAGFSPTVLPDVPVGSQRLRVVSPNRLPWTGEVEVDADRRSWLTVSLEEPPTTRIAPATWVTGSISAASLVAAGVLGIVAAKTHSDFEEAETGAERNALRERGMTLNTATDVALVTGAIAAVATVVLYFTTKEVRGKPSSAATVTQSKR